MNIEVGGFFSWKEGIHMDEQVISFCTDYFFHYLLIHSPMVRLCIAEHLSGLELKTVDVINSERYPSHKDGKKYVLDITLKDHLGNLYNIEMQNGYISAAELARFQIYTMSMIDLQIQEGVQYQDMRKVHSLIIYTGNPIRNFEHLWHEVELIDGKYEKELYNGLIVMSFLQTKKMKEVSMELARSDFYQLMRLFEQEDNHKEEQTSEVAKEAVELYDRFISLEEYIYYKAIQRDRLWAESKIGEGTRKGFEQGLEKGLEQGIEQGIEKGIEQGKREENLKRACQLVKKKYRVDNLEWLKTCTSQQLDYLFDMIINDIDYIRFQEKVLKHK